MNKAIKRVCNIDIKRYNDDKILLNNSGIFAYFDDDDIMNCKAMIIGPEDTPYAHGILFFDIHFTNLYPFEPPKVKYISNSMTRLHPNLYVNGKVCLSILGTWHGPGWTATMNIISLLTTIQSLLTSNPIEHEPHYEKETGKLSKIYIDIIKYEKFKSLIIGRYMNLRPDLQQFKIDMIRYMLMNKAKIMSLLTDAKKNDMKIVFSKVYSQHVRVDWSGLPDKLYNIFKDIDVQCQEDPTIMSNTDIPSEPVPMVVNPITPPTAPITPKKKYQRKCPNNPAKMYDNAFTLLSENDNKLYIVKEYTVKDKLVKRWVKHIAS